VKIDSGVTHINREFVVLHVVFLHLCHGFHLLISVVYSEDVMTHGIAVN